MSKEWENPGICTCCSDPMDVGKCLYVSFCPCLAVKDIMENIGSESGTMYCLATLAGCGICAFADAGVQTAKKAGVKQDDCCSNFCCLLFDNLVCHSCRIYGESVAYKAKGGETMER